MGMAASQARLLTLTARLADNELRSQTINNAKMRLAAESSRASEDYINALNNATMTFTSYDQTGTSVAQPLTFNALTAYSSYNTQYGLVNSAGQLLVSEADAAAYEAANGDLNKFLENKGLTFGTSYFQQVGNLETKYPAPYGFIKPEDLQSWYEEHVAYQNSSEVEEYEDLYEDFLSTLLELDAKMEYPIERYLTSISNNVVVEGVDTTSADYDSVSELRSAYLSDSISFGYANLQKLDFITDNTSLKNELTGLFNQYADYNHDNIVNTTSITQKTEQLSPVKETLYDEATGEISGYNYTIDEFMSIKTNASFEVIEIKNIASAASGDETADGVRIELYDDTNNYIGNRYENGIFNSLSGMKYPDCLTRLHIVQNYGGDSTGNADETYTFKKKTENGVDTWQMITTYNSTDANADILDHLNSSALAIIKRHISNTEFAEWLMDEAIFTNFPQYNDGTYTRTNGETMTWEVLPNLQVYTWMTAPGYYAAIEAWKEDCGANTSFNRAYSSLFGDDTSNELMILDEYTMVKDAFISFIFNDPSAKYQFPEVDSEGNYEYNDDGSLKYTTAMTVDEALSKGKITSEGLADAEYVLYLLGLMKDANGNSVDVDNVLTDDYETVIKVYMVDEVISENGEAKYAWIDVNDTQNIGNADAKAQWYTNLFARMQKGYKTLEDGLAASKEWIEYALESGIVTMEQVDKSYNWNPLSYKTCTKITEVTDDAAVALAEAEYTRAMNDIEAKDNAYDIQLKNIDTEHSALQTEYDVVKSVMNKNIERTFKFNQSA